MFALPRESNLDVLTGFESLALRAALAGLSRVNQMFSSLEGAGHGPPTGCCGGTGEAGVKWFEKPSLCTKKTPIVKGKEELILTRQYLGGYYEVGSFLIHSWATKISSLSKTAVFLTMLHHGPICVVIASLVNQRLYS